MCSKHNSQRTGPTRLHQQFSAWAGLGNEALQVLSMADQHQDGTRSARTPLERKETLNGRRIPWRHAQTIEGFRRERDDAAIAHYTGGLIQRRLRHRI